MTATKETFSLDPAFTPGALVEGFRIVSVEMLPEISGHAVVMRHEATGARTLWLACADTNRAFAIAFKTPPANDTGVFHILEHSVLCGSERFPVKEPFVNLLKSSMQTFLNALTFPDKTMYPVASTNGQDLLNLMDVYLDAVLHPAIYAKPRIFEQEGWHYEQDGEGAPLTYNGVVLNEMKGAFSDPDEVLMETLNRQLFPDTCYGFESGGDPRAIPQLTYDEFLATHVRHYNLPNSYTVLYGDIDTGSVLPFLGERFCGAELREAGDPNVLALQAPVRAGLSQVTMATAPENATVGAAYVFATSSERERVLAADILLDTLMGSNEAPLKRRLLEEGLGDDVSALMLDGIAQPLVLFQLKGAHEGVAGRFVELVEQCCAELVRDGIPRTNLEASLAQAEFQLREGDFGWYADGVALAVQAMSSWLYDDDDPVAYLRYEEALANMRAGLDDGYFERLLASMVCDCAHSAAVELIPVEQGDAAEEVAELAAKAAELGDEGLAAVRAETAALRAEQERADSPEDLAKLPQLGIEDIGEAAPEPAQREVAAPLPCFHHQVETHGIDYVYGYFGLDCLSFDELPYASVLCEVLGRLDTRSHTAAELDTLIELNLGHLSFFCETECVAGDAQAAMPMLICSASALSPNAALAATIPAEVWSETLFGDRGRIRDILQQRRLGMEQAFMGSGHACAIARASSYFSRVALAVDQFSGVGFYLFLKDLLDHFDERFDDLAARLADISGRVFRTGNAQVSFTGTEDDLARFWEAGGTLRLAEGKADPQLEIPEPCVKNEAFVVPANVCFVGEATDGTRIGVQYSGEWLVGTRAVSLDYLWNEVRVKGGAYGCGMRLTGSSIVSFHSYRDPGLDATVRRFEDAADWLCQWEPSASEFTGYVVSTVAGQDAPVKPRMLARRQDLQRLAQRPANWMQTIRDEKLTATPEHIREMAAALRGLPERRGICVFGSADIIASSKLGLDVIELMG